MHWPKDLWLASNLDRLTWFFAWMIRGETAVIRRMPILCGNDVIKAPLQAIDHQNDFVTLGNWQSATRQKIVLHVHNNQRIHKQFTMYGSV